MSIFIKSLGFSILFAVSAFSIVPMVASADTPWWCDTSFGAWWGVGNCGTTTGPAGVLVYVQTPSHGNYYNIAPRQPSDFTVSVSGQNPSPTTFLGSLNGSPVLLGSGSYSVYVSGDLYGYTPSYSSGCSGAIAVGEHALCVITMSGSSYSSYPTPYPYPCTVGPYGCTYQLPSLSCTPSYQSVAAGSAATFTAVGGSGSYNWTTPSRTYLSVGPVLSVVLQSYGTQTVVVTSGSQSAICTVNVVAGAPVYPVVSGITPTIAVPAVVYSPGGAVSVAPSSAVYTASSYVVAPGLPNTGFEPVDGAAMALALVFLFGAGIFVLPYVRKASASILG
ncbi:hypothetical protein HYS79_02405 [Patescibacteria group bacterium]|nr:hypothetical protein [Patescibacteria group bacterium]